MKIVCISDTHYYKNTLDLPSGDILIHAGDLTFEGTIAEIGAFVNWVSQFPFKHKIVIAGNHDWLFQTQPALAKQLLGPDIIYLQDSGVTIEGLNFWGTPWQPAFRNWAFNLSLGAQLKEKWDLIPKQTDLLITHSPPYGILDGLPFIEQDSQTGKFKKDKELQGCPDLLAAIKLINPKYHIFGHIHEGSGFCVKDKTTFINAAICDGQYKQTNKATVIDTEANTVTRRIVT